MQKIGTERKIISSFATSAKADPTPNPLSDAGGEAAGEGGSAARATHAEGEGATEGEGEGGGATIAGCRQAASGGGTGVKQLITPRPNLNNKAKRGQTTLRDASARTKSRNTRPRTPPGTERDGMLGFIVEESEVTANRFEREEASTDPRLVA